MPIDHTKYMVGYLSEDGAGIDLLHARSLWPALRGLVDKRLIVSVEVYRKRRSGAQNRYFHGVLLPSVQAYYEEREGEIYDEDEAKMIIYQRVLGHKPKIMEVDGRQVIAFKEKPLSKLNTKEFGEAVHKIWKYYDERDWVIPAPPEKEGDGTLTEAARRAAGDAAYRAYQARMRNDLKP